MRVRVERKRDAAVTIRMTPDEVAMLRDIAEWIGLSQSDIIRQYIRREHERLSTSKAGQRGKRAPK